MYVASCRVSFCVFEFATCTTSTDSSDDASITAVWYGSMISESV